MVERAVGGVEEAERASVMVEAMGVEASVVGTRVAAGDLEVAVWVAVLAGATEQVAQMVLARAYWLLEQAAARLGQEHRYLPQRV